MKTDSIIHETATSYPSQQDWEHTVIYSGRSGLDYSDYYGSIELTA